MNNSVVSLSKMPKGWYVPSDPASYNIIRELGIPMLLIPKDYLPMLRLVLSRKKVTYSEECFWDATLIPKMERIGSSWNQVKGRTCSLDLKQSHQSHLTFSSAKTETNRKTIAKLESNLATFFIRWGIKFFSDFNEKGSKYRLTITFQFKGDVSPLIPTITDEPKKVFETILGFTMLRFTFYEKQTEELRKMNIIAPSVLVETCTQAGSEWLVVHSTTFKPSQLVSLTPLMGTVGMLATRCKQEDDRK